MIDIREEKSIVSVKDNFLDSESFLRIQNEFMSRNFQWNYQNTVVSGTDEERENPDIFQFTNLIWNIADGGLKNEKVFKLIKPLLSKINAVSIIKIKANLNTKRESPSQYKFHRDCFYPTAKTSIFYLNTNNGVTVFKNGQSIKSIANRLVTFDNSLLHAGKPCSNKSVRVLLNINYFDY